MFYVHRHENIAEPDAYSHTHDVLTAFMTKHGFEVTPHYFLDTAWLAKFKRGNGGRTLGINSEMDALPGIGHACGHNLIAISGVAVAIAVKKVMEEFDIAGTISLLGTPGESFPWLCFFFQKFLRWNYLQLRRAGTERSGSFGRAHMRGWTSA